MLFGATSVIMCATAMAVAAAERAEPMLYRIFLTDGATLVSYGDYARVGDRVVFSMALGLDAADPRTQLVSIPSASVDWDSTDRYAESLRYVYYAATRGEAEFTLLTAEVARVLNEMALTSDPARRAEIAQYARQKLVEWTRANYGYRAEEVREIVVLLDEAISGFQAANLNGSFDLSFVATTARPPRVPLIPKPSLQEAIAQALTASRLTPVPAERLTLLQAVIFELDSAGGRVPPGAPGAAAVLGTLPGWARSAHALAKRELEAELAVERAYGDFARVMFTRASAAASRADVKAVRRVVAELLKRDEELGRKRPDHVAALLTAVDRELDAARRLKLARDRWTLRVHAYRLYRRGLDEPLEQFDLSRAALDDIRLLAGPDPTTLEELEARLRAITRVLEQALPPSELQSVHGLFSRALALAASAVRLRHQAIDMGELGVAWDAAAAASGSLMLFDRARKELDRSLRIPELN